MKLSGKKYQQGGRPKGESTQLVRVRVAVLKAASLILHRMLPGRRDFTGQWIPGVFLESAVEGVALPVEGDEREVLPQGLRGKNTKKFLLSVEAVSELYTAP